MHVARQSLALFLAVACTAPSDDDGSSQALPSVDVSAAPDGTFTSLLRVTWDQPVDGDVAVQFRVVGDEDWSETPVRSHPSGNAERLVIGAPYGADIELQLVSDVLDADPIVVRTGDAPDNLRSPVIDISTPSAWSEEDRYILGSYNSTGSWQDGVFFAFIMDREGRFIWSRRAPRFDNTTQTEWTIFVRPSRARDAIFVDELTGVSGRGDLDNSELHLMTLNGEVQRTIAMPGAHHAWDEMPSGDIAYGELRPNDNEYLTLAKTDGTFETLWRCHEDFHEVFGAINGFGAPRYCGSNTLNYDDASGTFLYSFYSTSVVAEIDAETGENVAHFGQDVPDGWTFEPEDSMFKWQHGTTFTDAGTLLTSTQKIGDGQKLYAREYEVDRDNKVLREIWSFTANDQVEQQGALAAGEAHRLNNGNTLHNFGSGKRLREITQDERVVWDAYWEGRALLGRTEFISFDDLYAFLGE